MSHATVLHDENQLKHPNEDQGKKMLISNEELMQTEWLDPRPPINQSSDAILDNWLSQKLKLLENGLNLF